MRTFLSLSLSLAVECSLVSCSFGMRALLYLLSLRGVSPLEVRYLCYPRFAKSLRYGCRPACGDVEVADLEVFITITTTDHLLFQIRQVLVANLPVIITLMGLSWPALASAVFSADPSASRLPAVSFSTVTKLSASVASTSVGLCHPVDVTLNALTLLCLLSVSARGRYWLGW